MPFRSRWCCCGSWLLAPIRDDHDVRERVQTNQVVFDHPGVGTKTVPCTATTEFLDEEGNTVVIEITDAQIHLTPAR